MLIHDTEFLEKKILKAEMKLQWYSCPCQIKDHLRRSIFEFRNCISMVQYKYNDRIFQKKRETIFCQKFGGNLL